MAADYFAEIAERHNSVSAPARELSAAFKEIVGLLEKISNKEMDPGEKTRIVRELQKREQVAIQQVKRLSGDI